MNLIENEQNSLRFAVKNTQDTEPPPPVLGSGIGTIAKKVGGKIAVKCLSKKSATQIKRIVTTTIDVAGKDRNMIKNLSWAVSQGAYKKLGETLLGKAIPQAFNSFAVGVSGYGTMGALYGFR